MRRYRICVVTAGHLATCPRMVKAADAFAEAGYDVTAVSTTGWAKWAAEEDERLYSARSSLWRWVKVRWSRDDKWWNWAWSGVRARIARITVGVIKPTRLPLSLLGAAHIRPNSELLHAASVQNCDLYYGGGSSLAATAEAAKKRGVPFALDLEDFHSAELGGQRDLELVIKEIERRVLIRAKFVTTASAPIAEAYQNAYGLEAITVNNTFPLSERVPLRPVDRQQPLRLYWFSQTIGPNRGLEESVLAAGVADVPMQLHLRGNVSSDYLKALVRNAAEHAKKLQVVHHRPASPDEMVSLAGEYDVGLCLERTEPLNRDLCLTNKAFTYMLAGLALVLTATAGQKTLAASVGEGAFVYEIGDIAALGARLRLWDANRDMLDEAKSAAWNAARVRWHWEHAQERGALLQAVERVFRN